MPVSWRGHLLKVSCTVCFQEVLLGPKQDLGLQSDGQRGEKGCEVKGEHVRGDQTGTLIFAH